MIINRTNNFDKVEYHAIVEEAEKQAKRFKEDRLKTNQIRNFYAAISKMRVDFEKAEPIKEKGETKYDAIKIDLIMLKPKLAYAAGRQKAVRSNFYPFMKNAIEAVEGAVETIEKEIEKGEKKEILDRKDEAVKKFFALIESVVAYHKYYGND